MPDEYEFNYLKKDVMDWSEAELRHAQRHPQMMNKSILPVIGLRIDKIDANKRLVSERSKSKKRERKLLLSFVDPKSKPSKSVDYVSVKQSLQDASTTRGGGPAITLAMAVGAYDWLCGHPEITGLLPKMSPVLWYAVILCGAGWWLILFTKRLSEKWLEEH